MHSQRFHPAPTDWYNHTELYTDCVSTLHPPTDTPSHIESYIPCVFTLHPPTVMPSHIQSYSDCVNTLHPPIITPSHIEAYTVCVSTLQPPTATASHIESCTNCLSTHCYAKPCRITYSLYIHLATTHIESYTDSVSTLQLSIAGLANHHHSSLCCCSIVQTVRPASSHNICLAFFRSVGLTGHCTNCFPLAACYDSNYHLLLGHTDLHPASHSKPYAHHDLPDIHSSVSNPVTTSKTIIPHCLIQQVAR